MTGEGGAHVIARGEVYPMKASMARFLLNDVAILQATDTLAEDRAALPDDETLFGLDPARETVTVTYTDGTSVTFRVGSRCDEGDVVFYYMAVDGDPRLYALDVNAAEDLGLEAAQLIAADSLDIQVPRIDRIEVEDASGRRVWQLEGEITDPDAIDRWVLAEPFRYPADGEAIGNLKKNCANMYLNSYVGPASATDLAALGLEEPTAVITVHMAAGLTYRGMFEEETVTVVVGGLRGDIQRYVLVNGSVYQITAFHISGVVDTVPADTLTRYPVLTSLSNLGSLTRASADGTVVWSLTRETGPEGERVTAVTRNGEAMGYEAFTQRYNRMLAATVAGILPEGYVPGAPHTVWTFDTVTGITHTIALSDYDQSHDAVTVDGETFFYMRKNALGMEAE